MNVVNMEPINTKVLRPNMRIIAISALRDKNLAGGRGAKPADNCIVNEALLTNQIHSPLYNQN